MWFAQLAKGKAELYWKQSEAMEPRFSAAWHDITELYVYAVNTH